MSKYALFNDSKIYTYMRTLSGLKDLPSVLCYGSVQVTSGPVKVELFNTFFHSVFNTVSDTFSDLSTSCENTLSSINISLEDTFRALGSLDPSKAMGEMVFPPLS